jgi:hypothetical protein
MNPSVLASSTERNLFNSTNDSEILLVMAAAVPHVSGAEPNENLSESRAVNQIATVPIKT